MSSTPRLRSVYPSTPASDQKSRAQHDTTTIAPKLRYTLQPTPSDSTNISDSIIPLTIVGAPRQRLCVSAFYVALTLWRLSDYFGLSSGQEESLWLFLKWLAIDAVFLYGLPELQIPWLQWSSSTTAMLVIIHTLLNAILMFQIPVCPGIVFLKFGATLTMKQIPLSSWSVVFSKALYDRELALLERSVKPATILDNSSLILGKQIIHILPEGYVKPIKAVLAIVD